MPRIITCKLSRKDPEIISIYIYVTQSSRTREFVSALLCKLGMELYSLVQMRDGTHYNIHLLCNLCR